MNPSQLGPYEILGVLGRGGMGTVYRARHFETGEVVALKALSQNYIDDDHFRQRFESEINALIKLDHPNIVRLLGYGQDEGMLYFAMELVDGKSLYHLQREFRTFDWRDVLVVAKDVASGLRHAHDRGIIHRDLKPGNLLKVPNGSIKVTDFGIAKSFGQDNNTRDNVVGTIDFMSPEQAMGKPVTVRSDLYSLGVVLFTLLSGQPPFNSASMEQSLRNLTSVPPPKIRSLVPNVPVQLEQLIDELLEKRPERRTPTALALLRKLEQIEAELRDYSEAKTAHGQPSSSSPGLSSPGKSNLANSNPANSNPANSNPQVPPLVPPTPAPLQRQDTFRLGEPQDLLNRKTGESPKTLRPGADDTGAAPQKVVTSAAAETSIQNDPYNLEPLPEKSKKKPDYFAPVTDHQRRQHSTPKIDEEKHSRGFWLTFLALAAVLTVGIAGTYYALKPPTADQLYSTIEFGSARPERLHEQLDQFVKLYPDDPRISRVSELKAMADALSRFKRLSIRRNLPGSEMSQLEKDFVDVVRAALDDPALGYGKLEAFITLNPTGPDVPRATEELVTDAQALRSKLKADAGRKELWDRQHIQDALQRAANEPDGGKAIYRSIIALYENFDWAREEVEYARRQLQ